MRWSDNGWQVSKEKKKRKEKDKNKICIELRIYIIRATFFYNNFIICLGVKLLILDNKVISVDGSNESQ